MEKFQKTSIFHVVGGGLAGCEAAWQLLRAGFQVVMHEMRPVRMTPAHQTGNLAELVCSNSFKSTLPDSAPGRLKEEMLALDSLIVRCANAAKVPAGNALAVDRTVFSSFVARDLEAHPSFTKSSAEVTSLPDPNEMQERDEYWIVATGPLTTESLASELQRIAGAGDRLFFFDAIAPVIATDSIDFDYCFRASRYGNDSEPGAAEGDYLNIPLNRDEYEQFIDALATAEYMPLHEFEKVSYFEACLPIEVMVARGRDTLRFGPMKPVGLTDPRTGRRPWAAIQLRQENLSATMYSMVGFQTKMKWPEQRRVFSMLPALKNAEFLRYGSIHRNTYLQSPKILNSDLSFRLNPRLFLAGQITGVEGYLESAAMGLVAGRAAASLGLGGRFSPPPPGTVIGALLNYVTCGGLGNFQPMNANLGLLPPVAKTRGVSRADRKHQQCEIARKAFDTWRAAELQS